MGNVSPGDTGEWSSQPQGPRGPHPLGGSIDGPVHASFLHPSLCTPSPLHPLTCRSAAYTDTHLAKETSSSSCAIPVPFVSCSPPLLGRKQSTVDLASQRTWLDEPPFPTPQDTATCEYPVLSWKSNRRKWNLILASRPSWTSLAGAWPSVWSYADLF